MSPHRRLLLVALGVTVAAVSLASMTSAQEDSLDDAELFTRGGELFQANCAACHGTRLEGGPGPGVLRGPTLAGVDISYVDMTLRTGRMPIPEASVGIHTDRLDDQQREAVVHYLRERFDLPGQIPQVEAGDPGRGQLLYARNCAACHGAAGDGGISGARVRVPPLVGIDPVAIAQATRVGPFEMPAFDPAVLDDDEIDDIIGYLQLAEETPRTAAGVRHVDQISSGLFALGLGLVCGLVVLVVAYARRWYPREPGGLHESPPFESRS